MRLHLAAALLAAPTALAARPCIASKSTSGPIALDTVALDSTIRAEMRDLRAPGASIAVVVGDRIVFARGYGTTSVEGGAPVDSATLFRIGSTTKMFTGLTALRLAERDSCLLRRPIGRYARGLAPALQPLTLHQLLSHTAGMTNAAAANGPHDPEALGARVRGWGAAQRFAAAGDIYSYSGPGYWLAGYAIEQAGGRWYADVVDSLVLEPLGMTRSTFWPLEAFTHPIAQDHRVGQDGVARVVRPFPDDVTTWASGSLFSSAWELGRFAIAMLNEGRIDGEQVMPARTIAPMYEPRAPVPGGGCAYTYGLATCEEAGVRTFSHAGFRGGSGSIVTLVPAHRIAVIVISNRNGGIFRRTERRALELLLPRVTAAGTPTPPAATPPPPHEFDGRRRASLAGAYVNGPDTLRLLERDGRLVYRYRTSESPTRPGDGEEILVLDAAGEPVQGFLAIRGAGGDVRFLHDGLSAFRRVTPARRPARAGVSR
jgi:CubicO group peptidase (beta-lactamase class C family)